MSKLEERVAKLEQESLLTQKTLLTLIAKDLIRDGKNPKEVFDEMIKEAKDE